jgi:murein DD-endopeptidase MepM/ murein hydrolase activator NlpD
VIIVKEDSKLGGPTADMVRHENFVWIDHGAGCFTIYAHLQFASVPVQMGDLVNAGQIIGSSGSTGFATGPHLHFAVTASNRHSIESRFEDVQGDGVPVAGQTYTSGNDGYGVGWFSGDSMLARDTFAADGVLLTSDMPAAFLGTDTLYAMTGSVTKPCTRVRLFFCPLGSTDAIAGVTSSVAADGSFQISLRLSDYEAQLKGIGVLQYGVSPIDDVGHFWCKTMPGLLPRRVELDEHGKNVVHLGLPFLAGEQHHYKRVPPSLGQETDVALAFLASEKTHVLASGNGRVVAIGRESDRLKSKDAKARNSSYVMIDHGGGMTTEYSGLASESVVVHECEIVQRGTLLGLSSRSARLAEPNFAFAIHTSLESARSSVFDELGDAQGFSDAGEVTAKGPGDHPQAFESDSLADGAAFVQNGVTKCSAAPAYAYQDARRYVIHGETADVAPQVAFLIRRRGENKPAVTIVVATKERAFDVDVCLANRKKDLGAGPWEWTLTTSKEGKPTTTPTWLPLALMR